MRNPRLPWEFWELDTLIKLLQLVSNVIKVNQNTLLSLKGKFAWVCVNIDTTKSLPRSLLFSFQGRTMKVPLVYKGLYEVCDLCASETHQIEV